MTIYILLFVVISFVAIIRVSHVNQDAVYKNSKRDGLWYFAFLVLTFFVGLRHNVGADWFSYLEHVMLSRGEPFNYIYERGDVAYAALNWFGANVFGGIYLVNFFCAGIFSFGLIVFCRAQPLPWVAMMVAFPYLVTVVAMGYTRQSVAIGLSMIGLRYLLKGEWRKFLIIIAFAATFHKSAVVLIPFAIFANRKIRFSALIYSGIFGVFLVGVLLLEHLPRFQYVYLEREYESAGASVRLLMNAIPALLFLFFRKQFQLDENQFNFLTWFSLTAILLALLLFITPSSAALDRVSLYWIPIQLVVYAYMPLVFRKYIGGRQFWILVFALFYGLILMVWLIFADNSASWIPYQFILINSL
jgi:hypothetical protein